MKQAETDLMESRNIKTTVASDILLSEVYLKTNQEEKGLDLLENLDGKEILDSNIVIMASELLMENKRVDEAENILKRMITETRPKDNLKEGYDNLIKINLIKKNDDLQIKSIIEEAKLKTGDERFTFEKVSDLSTIEEYFEELFDYSMAIIFYGFMEDFTEIKEIQQEWVIYKYINDAAHDKENNSQEKYQAIVKKYPKNSGRTFVYLSDIERVAKKSLNSEVELKPNEAFSEFKQFVWHSEDKMFSLVGKGYPLVKARLYIDEAYQIGDRVYIYGSEIIEGDYDNDYPQKGDKGKLFCEDLMIGSTTIIGSKTSSEVDYNFTVPLEKLPKHLYILEQDENQKYCLVSKEKTL